MGPPVQTAIASLNLFMFALIGLGTPFIWLAAVDPGNTQLWKFVSYSCLLFILFSSLVLCLTRPGDSANLTRKNLVVVTFLVFIISSLLWSPVSLPQKLSNTAAIFLCIFVALSSAVHLSLAQRVLVILAAAILPVLMTILFVWLDLKSIRIDGDTGFFINRNLYNRLLQIVLICSLLASILWGAMSGKPATAYVFLSIITAILAGFYIVLHPASSGKLVLCFCLVSYLSWCVVWFCRKYGTDRLLLWLHVVSGLGCIAGLIVFAWDIGQIQKWVPEISDMLVNRRDSSYRFHLWQVAVQQLEWHHWIVGAGFDGFWGGEKRLISDVKGYATLAHAHNGFIDLFLQTGLIGCCLLSLIVFLSARQYVSRKEGSNGDNSTAQKFAWSFMLIGLVSMNLFESVLLPVSTASFLPFTMFLWAGTRT